jgi:hypothetical protein
MAAIPEACAILTSFRHCQRQAAAFRKCTELHGGSGGDVAQKCAFEHDSFVVCADESLEQVVTELMAVASKKCPAECAAHNHCLANDRASGCEQTDEAALNCAATHVIQAARAMTAKPRPGGHDGSFRG